MTLRLLSAALLLAAPFSPAWADAANELRELAPAEAPPAPPTGPTRELSSPERAAPPVAEILDPRFLGIGQDNVQPSKAEWRRRLRSRGNQASFALLSPPDGKRQPLILVLGVGMNFPDAWALARLDDTYQVAVAVVDERLAIPEAGRRIAAALERLTRERGWHGPLRVVGHSFGGPIALWLLHDLGADGVVGPSGAFPRALLVAIDGPWRGVDLPWPALLPGVRRAFDWGALHFPLPERTHVTHGTLSLLNHSPAMRSLQDLELPPELTLKLATVLGPQGSGPHTREFEPIADWYPQELGAGELERLWKTLRRDRGHWRDYDSWAWGGLVRKEGLQNLERMLERDGDWPSFGWRLRQAALESSTLDEFKTRYEAVLRRSVATFHGDHTHFMWEDPAFLPWIRARLAAW